MRTAHKILVRKPEKKRPLGNLYINGRIILEWIINKLGARMQTEFIWLRAESSCGFL
jgi:hypothetical protein